MPEMPGKGANHPTAECNKPTACRTCGKEHRTAECSEEDQTKFWCANCNTHGHASWDRMCPRLIEMSRRLAQLDPSSMYIYFLSDETWTWEKMRAPDTNEWETNNIDLTNFLNRESTRQERHLDNERNMRREPEHSNERHRPGPVDEGWQNQPG